MDDFTLQMVTYFLIAITFIVATLNIIQYIRSSKIKKSIDEFELEKNKVISAPIMTELSKVETLAKNEVVENRVKGWQERFANVKNNEIPSINDLLLEADYLFERKKYGDIVKLLAQIEIKLYEARSKTNHILEEVQEITLSEEKNRNILTNLKSSYRSLLQTFMNSKDDYGEIANSIELQFENIERRFQAFEKAMEASDYDEVDHIVKAVEEMIKHMEVVIEEVPSIVLSATIILPKRITEVLKAYEQMQSEGYQLDFLNVEYNVEEIEKKINDITDRVKVLNLEEVVFELKTFMEYFDNLFNDFEREKLTKKVFEESVVVFKTKMVKLNRVVNEFYDQLGLLKRNYSLSEKELDLLDSLSNDLGELNVDFKALSDTVRTKAFPYSKLSRELDVLALKLSKIEERLEGIISSLGSMKDDEARAKEQFDDINAFLTKSKAKIREYKLPVIPNTYFIQLKEAQNSIKEITIELEKKPINIEILNIRVDTARDLVLKLYNSTNEMIKTSMLAEMAIIYGNRYKSSKVKIEDGLNRAEILFIKGDYKHSLEVAINTIDIVEPGFYRHLLTLYEGE
ncbi:MAG: septation ring formation regulator EzrA [Bacilli bacterium]|nr:septation ring formation regulator EzrA [Bacilli bacterium]MDD3304883.1 septation ring formation regulator EzrA [Bacilli bacterium]MDD4053517.1 septation ring formation regulator EzrA [Bacilli bacterium]MDD4411552.1 septation ring formation regulator EzrA [Bacilli bacterium]